MAFKNIERKQLNFSDMAVKNSLSKNISYDMLLKLNSVINWKNIEVILEKKYQEGQSEQGAKAYHPLFL